MTKMDKSNDSGVDLQRRPESVPERAIVLIGLMGAGKTCVGRKLAARIGRPFVDADAEIELAAGCTISEIFERMGEAAFRNGERRVMARLLDGGPAVLASGGGAFIDPETRRLIAAKAISVWLRADLELLVKRTSGREHRPLLSKGDPREALRVLMEKRYPIYAEADVVVDTLDQPAEATVERVLAALAAHAPSGVQAVSVL
jgi:shikimate kinase